MQSPFDLTDGQRQMLHAWSERCSCVEWDGTMETRVLAQDNEWVCYHADVGELG